MEERCVFCGGVIPEGRQVCPACFEKYTAPEPRAERTIAAQSDLKEALDRLSEATINAIAALERLEMVTKEGRAKNGNKANS